MKTNTPTQRAQTYRLVALLIALYPCFSENLAQAQTSDISPQPAQATDSSTAADSRDATSPPAPTDGRNLPENAGAVESATPAATGSDPNTSAAPPPSGSALGSDVQRLNVDRGWPAGHIQKQLDKDTVLLPYGKGAIFAPAMTDGRDEPPVTVWAGNEKVAEATTGTRIPLTPGEYFVEVGSGTVDQRFGRTVMVEELKITVVPTTWSGLTVHVVDPQLNSLRVAYELIRMSDREYLGAGFGVDEQAGETPSTWILQPGLYKVVRVGGTYRDRQDFATVRLVEGLHTHYLLVLDPDTNEFKGAGEARPEELFRPDQTFHASLILGGDLSLNARQGAVGYVGGTGFALKGFLDAKINALIFDGPLLLRLQINEGQTRLATQKDFQKIADIVQADALYIYSLKPWAGPYIRYEGSTNLFATTVTLSGPYSILDATTGALAQHQTNGLKLTPPFGTISMREGAGINLRLLKALFGELNLRTGLGVQQAINRDVLQQTSPNTYVRLASGHTYGIEGTLIGIGRITRWVVISALVDALIPFTTQERVSLNLAGTLIVKLTQYAATTLGFKYQRGPLLPTPILEFEAQLRFSLELI